MYNDNEAMEKALTELNYRKVTRKPWNVREGDVIILEQYGMGFLNSGFFPVEVTLTDAYSEYRRSDVTPTPTTKVSHKTFKFYHKALHATDTHRLTGWQSTYWYTFDDVEVWRPIPTSSPK